MGCGDTSQFGLLTGRTGRKQIVSSYFEHLRRWLVVGGPCGSLSPRLLTLRKFSCVASPRGFWAMASFSANNPHSSKAPLAKSEVPLLARSVGKEPQAAIPKVWFGNSAQRIAQSVAGRQGRRFWLDDIGTQARPSSRSFLIERSPKGSKQRSK